MVVKLFSMLNWKDVGVAQITSFCNVSYKNFTLSEDIMVCSIAAEIVAELITNSFVLVLTLCYLLAKGLETTILH